VGINPARVTAFSSINAPFPGCVKAEFVARQYLSGPQITYIHYDGHALIGGAIFDILFNLAFPCNVFFLVGNNQPGDTIYLSLKPTNKPRPGSAAVPVLGNEEWFPMTALGLAVTGPNVLSVIRFKEPVNQIYLSHGTEGGLGPVLTFACVNDPNFTLNGGPWGI
jgi:hypothetical protein